MERLPSVLPPLLPLPPERGSQPAGWLAGDVLRMLAPSAHLRLRAKGPSEARREVRGPVSPGARLLSSATRNPLCEHTNAERDRRRTACMPEQCGDGHPTLPPPSRQAGASRCQRPLCQPPTLSNDASAPFVGWFITSFKSKVHSGGLQWQASVQAAALDGCVGQERHTRVSNESSAQWHSRQRDMYNGKHNAQ